MPPPPKRRRVDVGVRMKGPRPEELTFDFAQRQDYLTGFHKRKQARVKHTQELAAKKEREERIRDRKELRQKRKEELEEHVKAVNKAMRIGLGDVDGEDGEEERAGGSDAWSGVSGEEDEDASTAAPAVQPVDHEDEYVDEDKYTTVTVEEVAISKHGFDTENADEGDEDERATASRKTSIGRAPAKSRQGRTISRQEEREGRSKKKRKKFKYESKANRKMTKAKEGVRNSKAAKARKGK